MARPKEKTGRYMRYDKDDQWNEKQTKKETSTSEGAQPKHGRPRKPASARTKSLHSPSGYKISYMYPKEESRDSKFDGALSSGEPHKTDNKDGSFSLGSVREKERKYAKQNGNRSNSRLKRETTEDSFQSAKEQRNAAASYVIEDRQPSSGRQKQVSKKEEQTERMPPFQKNGSDRRSGTKHIKQNESKREPQIKTEPIDESFISTLSESTKIPNRSYSAKLRRDSEKVYLRSPTVYFSPDESELYTSVPPKQSPTRITTVKHSTGRKTKKHFMTVIIMNASGPSGDKGPEPAPRQKQTIYDVINKFSPDIVLFQEFTWKTTGGKNWQNYSLPDRYYFSGHEHAALLIDEDQFEFKDFPSGTVDKLISRTQKKMNRKKYKLSVDQNEFAPRARMAMRRFIKKVKGSKQEIIVISWHGRSNQHGRGGGLTVGFKEDLFRYLFEFLCQIRDEFKLPIIIGGDFNIEIDYINQHVMKPFQLITYTSSERRTKGGTKGVIDYYIATDDLDVSGVRYIDLEEASTAKNPNQVLDHDPVIANVDFHFQRPKPKDKQLELACEGNLVYPRRHRDIVRKGRCPCTEVTTTLSCVPTPFESGNQNSGYLYP